LLGNKLLQLYLAQIHKFSRSHLMFYIIFSMNMRKILIETQI